MFENGIAIAMATDLSIMIYTRWIGKVVVNRGMNGKASFTTVDSRVLQTVEGTTFIPKDGGGLVPQPSGGGTHHGLERDRPRRSFSFPGDW